MAKKILGFDIGTHALKVAKWDGERIEQLAVAEMPDGLCRAGVISSYDAMADLIKETLAANNIKGKEASLVLPSGHSFVRRLQLPYMTEKQLVTDIPYEFKDFLTHTSDKYYFDYTVNGAEMDDQGVPVKLDVTAAAALKEVIQDYRNMFSGAGLELVCAMPVEMAYAELAPHMGDVCNGQFAILDLGHVGCRLDVYSKGVCEATRMIEIGLVELDKIIASEQFVDVHIAHSYKENNYNNVLASASARTLYTQIAADVRKAINFFNFSNQDKHIESLYLCGGGVSISALVEAIRTQVPEVSLQSVHDLCPTSIGSFDEICSSAAAIGVAL